VRPKRLRLSWKVDECKPLRGGMRYELQLADLHRDRHALKLAMEDKDDELTRLNEVGRCRLPLSNPR
jgi:hypothetical protein